MAAASITWPHLGPSHPALGATLKPAPHRAQWYNSDYSSSAAPSPAQCSFINQTSRDSGVQRGCVTPGSAPTTKQGQWEQPCWAHPWLEDALGLPCYGLRPCSQEQSEHLPTPGIPGLPSVTGPNLTRPRQHNRNSPTLLGTNPEETVDKYFAIIAEHLPPLGPGRVGLMLLPCKY